MPGDLILELDDDIDSVLELDDAEDAALNLDTEDDLILMDDVPYTKHYDEYGGPYDVTPTFGEQALETEGLLTIDNVRVRRIPVTRTSNPYGGDTVVIG